MNSVQLLRSAIGAWLMAGVRTPAISPVLQAQT